MTARELLTFRDTNSAACRSSRDGPHCAGEDVLSVRQTGAVQCQRESSTEPHTKKVEMYLCHEARENFRPCLPSNFGGVANRQWGTGVLRTGRRLGDSSVTVYVHMDEMNQNQDKSVGIGPWQEPARRALYKRTTMDRRTWRVGGTFARLRSNYFERGPSPMLLSNNETSSPCRRTPVFAKMFLRCMRAVVRRIPIALQQSSSARPSIR